MASRKKKKEETNWNGCKGRTLLRKDIREKRIPTDMAWEDVYRDYFRPEFVVGESPEEAHRLFKGRLETARDYVSKKEARSAEEEAAMLHDRAVCPPPTTNHRGEPRWHGSAAEAALKEDFANGKHLTMTSDEFYDSRDEYSEFFKSTIKRHIRQEESTFKFLNQYRARYDEGY